LSATRTTIIAAVVLVLTFGAGFIGGAAAHHLFLHHTRGGGPPPVARALVRHLDRRLDLTDAQRKQVEAIVVRHHERMRIDLEAANAEIARVLTPAQQEKFAKMRLRLGRPHGKHGRP
jgi:hypothetical protein